jgi:hypothetical protein
MTDRSNGALDRATSLRVAHEAMLAGMLLNRALLPQVVIESGGFDAMNDVAIDLWMGASPVYTQRMRALMGIEGDTVPAIMKALQLDVGFVHQYMDVAYRVQDDRHGEFWLNHCGALLDAEPFGDERVFGMCHTIEDPTFDATALATNPRARIRPIHRPPRDPADRHPHCHWTIVIDPANEPVGPAVLTQQVGELPLASVPNPPPAGPDRDRDGRADYRGDFDPAFGLAALSTPALRAVQEEFVVQTHLLAASAELALGLRFADDVVRRMMNDGFAAVAWTTSGRLARALGLDARPGALGVAEVLEHQPLLPPGFTRAIAIDGDAATLVLTPTVDGLLDPDHPGIPGLLAQGDGAGLTAMVQAVDGRARVEDLVVDATSMRVAVSVAADADNAAAPDAAALMESLASGWTFRLAPDGR